MAMGKTRKSNKHLPRRMYLKHGAYWYVDRQNKWHRLAEGYAEALKRYAALLSDTETGTIESLVNRYERDVFPRLAEETKAGRKMQFKTVRAVFGPMHAVDLKPSDVFEFWQKGGRTSKVRHEISALSAVLGHAVNWGAIDKNPLLGMKFKDGASGPRTRYVTDDEFIAVREIAPLMIQVAMNIALITAMRQKDILRLDRRQVAEGFLTVTFSKTKKQRRFPIAGDLKENIDLALKQKPELRPHVIVSRKGKPYTRDGFQTQWQRVMKRALAKRLIAERFTYHDIRAKSLSEAETLEEAQKRAGHADSKITAAVYRRLPETATVASIAHLTAKRPA